MSFMKKYKYAEAEKAIDHHHHNDHGDDNHDDDDDADVHEN